MHEYSPNRHWIGTTLVLIAAAGFSAKSIFAKLGYQHGADALTMLTWRMLLALPFFVAAAWWTSRGEAKALTRDDWKQLLLMGVSGYYLSSILDFEGLMFISASLERLTLFLYPTLVVLLSAWFGAKKITARTWLALIISYAGMAMVVVHDLDTQKGNVWLGTALVFGSAFSYACYLVGSQPLISKLGSMRFTGFTLTIATICVLTQAIGQRGMEPFIISTEVFWLGLATALISTVMPVFLITAGIQRIGAEKTALLGSIGPVATLWLGAWLLSEPVGALQLSGAGLIITGVWIITRR